MVRIQHFNVVKTATVAAIVYMIVIAIFAVPFMLLFLFSATFASATGDQVAGGIAFGLVAILAYGLIGWVATAIAAAIYNLVAGWLGGIEVRVEPVAPVAPPPAWMQVPPPASPPTTPAS
jgi:hypothetical protein